VTDKTVDAAAVRPRGGLALICTALLLAILPAALDQTSSRRRCRRLSATSAG
jgi:hypothetical protein